MSRQLITRPMKDLTMYMLIASTEPNLESFLRYMGVKGVNVQNVGRPSPVYAADYKEIGLRLKVAYWPPGTGVINSGGHELRTKVGALLIVDGLEQKVVESEAQAILNVMGELEDPESVQYFLSREQKSPRG